MKTDDLISLLARQPGARPAVRPLRDLTVASAAAVGSAFALMLLLLGPRPDLWAAMSHPLFQQKVVALGLLAALSTALAYRCGLPGRELGRWRTARLAPLLWLLVATGATLATAPEGGRVALFWSSSIMVCLIMVPVLSIVPALAFLWMLRRSAPTDPKRAALAVGWAAGGTGALAYALYCSADQPGYVMLWYGLAIAIVVALVRLLGARALRW